MNWFYRAKRSFLIRLLGTLGFGGVIAYCICSCDSKSDDKTIKDINSQEVADNATKESQSDSETNLADKNANKKSIPKDATEVEFEFEYTPPNAQVTVQRENLTICQSSPCIYRFKLARGYDKLIFSATGYKSHTIIIDREEFRGSPIKVNLEPDLPQPQKRVPAKYGPPRNLRPKYGPPNPPPSNESPKDGNEPHRKLEPEIVF